MMARPERERNLRELRRILNNAYPEDYRDRSRDNLPAPALPAKQPAHRAFSVQLALSYTGAQKAGLGQYDDAVSDNRLQN